MKRAIRIPTFHQYLSKYVRNTTEETVYILRRHSQYKSRTTRVTLLDSDIARHYVPALFSTNHQWTHWRLGTACSGPTCVRRVNRAHDERSILSDALVLVDDLFVNCALSCSSRTTSARISSQTRRMSYGGHFVLRLEEPGLSVVAKEERACACCDDDDGILGLLLYFFPVVLKEFPYFTPPFQRQTERELFQNFSLFFFKSVIKPSSPF